MVKEKEKDDGHLTTMDNLKTNSLKMSNAFQLKSILVITVFYEIEGTVMLDVKILPAI